MSCTCEEQHARHLCPLSVATGKPVTCECCPSCAESCIADADDRPDLPVDLSKERLELGEAWLEWVELPDQLPTDRLLEAMGALLPDGFSIEPDDG